jgi:hypothetical protein
MAESTAELRFRVISLDSEVSPAELVSNLTGKIPDLTKELAEKYGEVQVEAEREKSIPIDPVTAYLVLKFAGAAIAGGFLKKLGEDAYTYLKNVIRNGSVEPPQ